MGLKMDKSNNDVSHYSRSTTMSLTTEEGIARAGLEFDK